MDNGKELVYLGNFTGSAAVIKEKMARLGRGAWTIVDSFVLAYFTDRPRRVKFVNSVLGFAVHERLKDRFPTVPMPALLRGSPPINLQIDGSTYIEGNVPLPELSTLCALARKLSARRIFEFGTLNGNTSYHLALNTPDDCEIFTVDIPIGEVPKLAQDVGDAPFRRREAAAYRWQGAEVARKIHPILSDSARLDPGPYKSSMDMVFVDGSHSAAYIANDTALAMQVVREGGIIVWHDYLVWNDVTTFLQKFSADHRLSHVAGTSLVIYQSS